MPPTPKSEPPESQPNGLRDELEMAAVSADAVVITLACDREDLAVKFRGSSVPRTDFVEMVVHVAKASTKLIVLNMPHSSKLCDEIVDRLSKKSESEVRSCWVAGWYGDCSSKDL